MSELRKDAVVFARDNHEKFKEFVQFLIIYRKSIEWIGHDFAEDRTSYRELHKGLHGIIRKNERRLSEFMYGVDRQREISRLFGFFYADHVHPLKVIASVDTAFRYEEKWQYEIFFSFFESLFLQVKDAYPETTKEVDEVLGDIFTLRKRELKENPLYVNKDIFSLRKYMRFHTGIIDDMFYRAIDILICAQYEYIEDEDYGSRIDCRNETIEEILRYRPKET